MDVIHLSAECYPAAKAGGLGDVVGALPKYLNQLGMSTGVVIPHYHTKWILAQEYSPVYSGTVRLHQEHIPFTILKERTEQLGFPLFTVVIDGKFDRPGVYADENGRAYGDELSRALCFQQAALQWIANAAGKPKVIHCHDHHTGLVPWLVKYAPEYQALKDVPTVFTIHNGQYTGAFGWDKLYMLPWFESRARGYLEWGSTINPLATAIKCAWRVTTVSPGYLQELMDGSNGLEWLLRHEWAKCRGILNGIDVQVWDPKTDPYLDIQLKRSWPSFKSKTKAQLCKQFNLEADLPVFTFIGRLVGEKGADLLPDLLRRVFYAGLPVNIIVLGTGQPWIHDALKRMAHEFSGRLAVILEYNEGLAHQLYAGSDFLLMPSKVEPCGLNQMYAMRYGTLPVVRAVGGLKDTVPDVGTEDVQGRGIQFTHFNLDDAFMAIYRASELYQDQKTFLKVRSHITKLDFSWEQSAKTYAALYEDMMD